MKAVLIRLDDGVHKQLRQKSVDTGRTVTAIVLEAIKVSLAAPIKAEKGKV